VHPESFEAALAYYATKTPAKVFCLFTGTGERLSYAELHRQVTVCTTSLQANGIGPGSRVAIQLPLSPQLIIHLLAVMCTGAVAVPVATSLHPVVIDSMIQILDPQLIIGPAGADPERGSGTTASGQSMCMQPTAGSDSLSDKASLTLLFFPIPMAIY
jgi:acyl-CoA synthetase (AMP-forming)/AMP-acid ligase II